MLARRRAAVLVAALLVLPLAAAPAAADDPRAERRRVEAQLAHLHDELHESSEAVQRAGAALARAKVEIPRAQAAYAAAQGKLSAARAAAAASRRDLDRAQADLDRAEDAFATANARLEQKRRRSGELSRAIYMIGPAGFAHAIFEAETFGDLAARATYTYALLSDAAGHVRNASTARVDLANRSTALEQRRADLVARDVAVRAALRRIETYAAESAAAKAAVDAQVAAREEALGLAARERAADLAHYQRLQAESRRLAELIRRTAVSRGGGRVGKGGMLWPTPGPVTSPYGYRMHPIYGYRRMHAGIDIGAPTGQAIVAVLTGTVVTAGPMGSYGNLVVVDHGDGLTTAYAHQSRVAVRSGQRVDRGAVIGYVGSTGASTGPHLHYETRVNGDPVDPMRYY
ncbi:MAG TPA: peptidoglycan DD-metalloendopeptidase family protein [Mycobacteriales bacterium]|nr:peptidoglycan DD-metalloendopeptidase family protein [Mycobacteriales bacterium]